MTAIDDARGELENLERKVREFFETAEGAFRALSAVPVPPGAPVLVSPEVVAAAREALQKVRDAVAPVFDRVGQLLEQPGDPDRLRQAAAGWTAIGNRLGATAGDVGLDRMRSNIEWTGGAAEAYKAMVPAQAEHLGTMKTQCVGLATSLDALAEQIDSFWTALTIALVAMVAAFAIAIASALSVVGIPAACAVLLTALAGGVAMIGTLVLQRDALGDRIATEQRAMAQSLDEIGPTWPAPNTAALADASVTDGDGSQWRPNR